MAWYSPDRFRTQGLLIALTSTSMAVLTAILVQDAWQSSRQTLADQAQQQCLTAVIELRDQYVERAAVMDTSEAEPRLFEALDLSLRGLSSAVLRSYDGTEGGFLIGPQRRVAGHNALSFVIPDGPNRRLESEAQLILDLAASASSTSRASGVTADGNDLLVGCATTIPSQANVAWVLKRVSGANNPAAQRRRWWLAALVVSAVLGLALTVSITFRLQHGVDSLNRGLARLEHDFNYRLPPIGGDLGGVAQAVNRMADRRGALEGSLRRQDRLAALGRVVSGVAHEIRNPLNSLRLTLELLDRRMRKGTASAEQVGEAIHEVDRLDQTVDRLLTIGRPDVRDRHIQDVYPLLERALRIVDDQAHQKQVRIVLAAAAAAPLLAEVDALAIEQILINLLMNAIDASPPSGTVTVSATRETQGLRIEVRDSGHGIRPQDREHIFSPYFTTKPNGTGLGLAISREMASHHDGDLEFESTPDGTTFALHLPAQAMRL